MDSRIHIINAKSLSNDQLYGLMDYETKQWDDGIIGIIMRECINEQNRLEWIVFDGPVDAIWVENLNTVMDDNEKLCLSSGEIIKLSSNVSILFEVEDLVRYYNIINIIIL